MYSQYLYMGVKRAKGVQDPTAAFRVSQFTALIPRHTQQLYRGYSSILVDFSEPPPQKKVMTLL